ARELFVLVAERAFALVEHLQHAADLAAPRDRCREHRGRAIADLLRERASAPPRIRFRIADVDELAGLHDVADDAVAGRYHELRQLGERGHARADLAGRA